MSLPFISVIVPSYNSIYSIEACLKSIIIQDHKPKEIIIVDGGSLDGTVELIEAYSRNYPFITVSSEKDKGVYDAMNKGIRMAAGEWIYFLGADDVLFSPSVLSTLFGNTYNQNVKFVYGDVKFLYSQIIYNGEFDLFRILFGGNICHQAIFYHRSVFETIGLFDLECKIYADHDFNIKCFLDNSFQKKYVKSIIAVYNESDGLSAKDRHDPVFRQKQKAYIAQFNRRPVRILQLSALKFVKMVKSLVKLITGVN